LYGDGGIPPCILNLDARRKPAAPIGSCTAGEEPGARWVVGWVGARARLDFTEQKKKL